MVAKTAAAAWIGGPHASGSRCCEPTWKQSPAGSRPRSRASVSTSTASARGAAELARERPVRALAGGGQPAQHGAARGDVGQLADLAGGVDDEQPHAESSGLGQVLATRDRVGVHEVLGSGAGVERRPQLGRAGHVEPAARPGQRPEQGRVRVGLDGVVHRRTGQGRGQPAVPADGLGHVQLEERACSAPGAGTPDALPGLAGQRERGTQQRGHQVSSGAAVPRGAPRRPLDTPAPEDDPAAL